MVSFARTLRLAAALLAFFVPSIGWAEPAQKTLRFIPQADLRSIDPIWTTAYITRNFGYMVFDTLFALDKEFKPQPQMVDTLDGQRRQADLQLHAARRPEMA